MDEVRPSAFQCCSVGVGTSFGDLVGKSVLKLPACRVERGDGRVVEQRRNDLDEEVFWQVGECVRRLRDRSEVAVAVVFAL